MSRTTGGPQGADQAGKGVEPSQREVTYTSTDGLRLHACDYGDPQSPWLPVVCLPGLTRNSRDFVDLAIHLAGDRNRPRRVAAFDYRGRGLSQWDKNPNNYNPLAEMADVFDGMARLALPRAAVVGTSRGGIIGMLMGIARPQTVAALVLNDIGPVMEARGLARIKGYIGGTPAPDDWADAAHIQRRLHGGQFPTKTESDWQAFARLTYRDKDGRPVGDYDPALSHTLRGIALDRAVPTLWDEFRALEGIPILVLRGENSDLLSAETVAAMAACHPRLETMTIPDEGHAPWLRPGPILDRISAFITAIEGDSPPADAVVPRREASYDVDVPASSNSPES